MWCAQQYLVRSGGHCLSGSSKTRLCYACFFGNTYNTGVGCCVGVTCDVAQVTPTDAALAEPATQQALRGAGLCICVDSGIVYRLNIFFSLVPVE